MKDFEYHKFINRPALKDMHSLQLAGRRNPVMQDLGQRLLTEGKVTLISEAECEAVLEVANLGAEASSNKVYLWTDRNVVSAECDCRKTQGDQRLICEHKAAAYDFLMERHKPRQVPAWERAVKEAVEIPRPETAPKVNQVLIFALLPDHPYYKLAPYSLPASHFKDIDVWDAVEVAAQISTFGLSKVAKTVTGRFNPERFVNVTQDAELAIRAILFAEQANRYNYSKSRQPIDSLLRPLAAYPIFLGDHLRPLQTALRVNLEPASAELQVETDGDGLRVQPALVQGGESYVFGSKPAVALVFDDPVWAMAEGKIFPVDGASGAFVALAHKRGVDVPAEDRSLFLSEYLPRLAERTQVRSDLIDSQAINATPQPRIYLQERDGELLIELRFAYDGQEIEYDPKAPVTVVRQGSASGTLSVINRQPDAEKELWSSLTHFGLKRGETASHFSVKTRVEPVDFLIHQVPKLTGAGFEIYGDGDLKSVRVNRSVPRIDFSVSSGIDWLDLSGSVMFGESRASFAELRKAIKRKERFVKLTDGSIGAIPEEWLKRYRHLFAFGQETDEGVRISNHHIVLLEEALEGADNASVDEEFQRRRDRLRAFSQIAPRELPVGLRGTMRTYQKAGYDWLHFLHDYEFGGCLADDMGTGKTIQALAFLLSLKESGHAKTASLIVVPRSLLFNWEREAAKFTPDLRVHMHSENDRARITEHFEKYDLILTTYGVMMRDIEMLRRYPFHYVLLDESQAIKNPFSLTGRAARTLVSDHRLSLTGTPVENGTIELWSQFAFLNPGLLGSQDYFRDEFVSAIEKIQDEDSAQLLRKMVYPFILRRTKDQVATDLPSRTERIVYAQMEPEQRALYEQTRDRYRDEVLNIIKRDGMPNARMRMLEALLRLRQIACHPGLVEHGTLKTSGKFELLLETLETLRSEGHKALIFSQFVQMLKLVRGALDESKTPYLYLDGQTKDRQQRVDEFQRDPEVPFFLISLKAGGVGLNLTAADYVIHIDPWWNPAVERQASDRTHRIGQDKPVFVYKLITKDTVEEKIVELQERKRSLVDQIVTTEQSFFKSLGPDDVSVLFG